MTFDKPMLAASLLKPSDKHDDATILAAMRKLRYPVLATLKKDGIRAIKLGDLASRTIKKIPNLSISARSIVLPYGYDMELWNPELPYDQIESIVMSANHIDSDLIQFHVLDNFNFDSATYEQRLWQIRKDMQCHLNCPFWNEMPSTCNNANELMEMFLKFETQEGEGICFRTPMSPYKQGRSTLREQYLVKLARYIRSECTVIGFEEQMYNGNPDRRNALGKMNRSSAVANLTGKCTLGAFLVRYENGIEGRVGTGVGLTDVRRAEIWAKREEWLGQRIVIKHKPHGQKIKPRSPIWLGKRSEIDL